MEEQDSMLPTLLLAAGICCKVGQWWECCAHFDQTTQRNPPREGCCVVDRLPEKLVENLQGCGGKKPVEMFLHFLWKL